MTKRVLPIVHEQESPHESDIAMKPQTQHNLYSRIHFTKITVLRDSFKMLPESLHFWEIQNSIIT